MPKYELEYLKKLMKDPALPQGRWMIHRIGGVKYLGSYDEGQDLRNAYWTDTEEFLALVTYMHNHLPDIIADSQKNAREAEVWKSRAAFWRRVARHYRFLLNAVGSKDLTRWYTGVKRLATMLENRSRGA